MADPRSDDARRPDAGAAPEQDLDAADVASSHDDATVRTPDTQQERLGEAGNAYVGREADRDLKTHPRVLDADRVLDDEGNDDEGDTASG